MQDYEGPPDYHPLIGQGAWPDWWVNSLALVVLIVALVAAMWAYRAGQRSRIDYLSYRRQSAIRVIFDDVRYELDRALLAAGEQSFGPAQSVLDTIDFYLGALLLVGKELGGPTRALREALEGKIKKASHGHGGHGGHDKLQTVVIATEAPTMSASAAGLGAASASVSGPTGGVTVLQPARVIDVGGHGPGHEEHPPTPRERVNAVREALETLSIYWERTRVEEQLSAVHDALSDARVRPGRAPHFGLARERPAARRRAGFEGAVAKAERDANSSFPWFKF